MENKQSLGKSGEEFAARFLIDSGLTIVTRNYRCPKGEMDIIARDAEALVFIEVRTRRSSYRGWGEESITPRKAQRLQAIASYYINRLSAFAEAVGPRGSLNQPYSIPPTLVGGILLFHTVELEIH
ncbi:YraN family protein [Desulfosporosinus sp. BICA1-9]|uniref:YraN family protein n=1 Tax=Desulfosporosinus sp. BICA1-9 TaxID=1531958 RepID=UPI0025BFD4C9|nr:YraN family protein [Desulfosporosinus sp. BICA1-9]